jgi:hypothetical protein
LGLFRGNLFQSKRVECQRRQQNKRQVFGHHSQLRRSKKFDSMKNISLSDILSISKQSTASLIQGLLIDRNSLELRNAIEINSLGNPTSQIQKFKL